MCTYSKIYSKCRDKNTSADAGEHGRGKSGVPACGETPVRWELRKGKRAKEKKKEDNQRVPHMECLKADNDNCQVHIEGYASAVPVAVVRVTIRVFNTLRTGYLI